MNFNCEYSNKFRILKGGKISLVVSALLGSCVISFAAPSGGVVTSGNANISHNGKITNITQSTQKASINWNKFNIAHDETVNFKQPNVNSITLNRVIGNEKSIINGALNANGQVWILNSNGVLFGKNASINTAGLLATTKNLSDMDFQAGNYTFKGNSTASVVNLGEIDITNSGYATLLANSVSNEGTIKAVKGSVNLIGANEVTINFNGNSIVDLTVNKGVLDALVQNKGAVYADGGEIYLTTNAVDELLKGVVNNTGIIEANSLDGITGYVELFAHGGTANVAGNISATDGFVETSADKVKIDNSFRVTADKWLIDPTDFTIAASGGDSTGTTISSNLATADIEIESVKGANGTEGNIYVNEAITWSADNTLTLNAQNNIEINEDITHTGTSTGGVIFLYGQAKEYGEGSSYSVASGKSVMADSIQWRKGSQANALRYAIVDNNIFLGNKYLEIGINSSNGKFGTTLATNPSLFFGRQDTLKGIGMVGDADGFGVGKDLRIDYFLPGEPNEAFVARYKSGGTEITGSNFATSENNAKYEILGINSDGDIEAEVTATLGDTLETKQTITLGTSEFFFNNNITLKNVSGSDIDEVAFARSFDPDNGQDLGGFYDTVQTIDKTISAGDTQNIISARTTTNDKYVEVSGDIAQIFYSSSDSKSKVGFDTSTSSDFFTGTNIDNMLAIANTQSKGDTISKDGGIGIIFEMRTMGAYESTTFGYKTYLAKGTLDEILGTTSKPKTELKSEQEKIQKVVTAIVNKEATQVKVPKIKTQSNLNTNIATTNATFDTNGKSQSLVSQPIQGETAKRVSLSEAKQMQLDSGGVENQDIRIRLSSNSIIELVNGGVSLPEGVEQEFYVADSQ